jgi:hypothetical protein
MLMYVISFRDHAVEPEIPDEKRSFDEEYAMSVLRHCRFSDSTIVAAVTAASNDMIGIVRHRSR